jgi:hypothetical protein
MIAVVIFTIAVTARKPVRLCGRMRLTDVLDCPVGASHSSRMPASRMIAIQRA